MTSDPELSAASTSDVVLGGAALAVGALIAGVALGRRSRWGLAFGLGIAAVAGYQLLKKSRQVPIAKKGPEPQISPLPVLEEISPPPVVAEIATIATEAPLSLFPPAPEQSFAPSPLFLADDEDSVDGEEALPEQLAAYLQEPNKTSEPAQEVLGEVSPYAFTPLMWEGGDSGSRSGDGEGETVWFGLQDVVLDLPAAPPALASAAPSAPVSQPAGEVAMEGDLAPAVSALLAAFPPAPPAETETEASSISPDMAALIQALNPPPLSPSFFNTQMFFAGSGVSDSEVSDFAEEEESHASPFLLDDDEVDGASGPSAKSEGSSLAAVALLLFAALSLGLGWMS